MIWFIVGMFIGGSLGFTLAALMAAAADPGPSDLDGPWMPTDEVPPYMWQRSRRIP